LIIVPNVACILGVFTLGFGIGASVVTNNVAALGALANGLWPMRKVAQLEAERRHLFELQLRRSGFLLVDGAQPTPAEFNGSSDRKLLEACAASSEVTAPDLYRAAEAAD
jgi:hypothetical protein